MSLHQLSEREVRIAKIQAIRNFGVVPYAQKFDKKTMISGITMKYEKDLNSENPFRDIEKILEGVIPNTKTAGRLMLFRSHGKLSFGKLLDESGDIQLMFHRDNCQINIVKGDQVVTTTTNLTNTKGEEASAYKFLEKFVDVGDFLGIEGELFYTHKGELTIFVSSFTFLAKAIQPLGDKFHGISGQETAYRQRYLDMIFNESTRERMKLRSNFLRKIRDFYHEHGFLEIETPVLGNSASGAAASPFVTHHNAFDMPMYLRISPETALKKATVGMFERVFEVAKDFRNEGSDPSHHQEFTMIEHYAAYWNYEDNMKFTEEMFDYLFENVPGLQKKIQVTDKQGITKDVDFSTPWQRIDYIAQVKKDSGIDISLYGPEDEDRLRADIAAKGHHWEGIHTQATATMIDYLYKKVTRPQITGPAFIFNYPKTMQPLARASDEDGNIVEQRQLLVNGWELIKAYSELVDPLQQQANFDEQSGALERGDEEATAGDDDFVKAMEYGMPPQSGRGMGIARILAILTEQSNIRDVILFPLVKPEANSSSGAIINEANTSNWDDVDYGILPARQSAIDLVDKYLNDTNLHCKQVGHIMEYFAKKLNQNTEAWYLAGLLHDVDWDHIDKDPTKHLGIEFEQITSEIDLPQALIDDIRSHYEEKTGVPVDLMIRKYLMSIDELSGLIFAYARMRPEGFEGMKRSSLNKKIKDKNFAAGVNRDHAKSCETLLSIPQEQFAMEIVEAMKSFS